VEQKDGDEVTRDTLKDPQPEHDRLKAEIDEERRKLTALAVHDDLLRRIEELEQPRKASEHDGKTEVLRWRKCGAHGAHWWRPEGVACTVPDGWHWSKLPEVQHGEAK